MPRAAAVAGWKTMARKGLHFEAALKQYSNREQYREVERYYAPGYEHQMMIVPGRTDPREDA